jgi:YD repeat-containing protein
MQQHRMKGVLFVILLGIALAHSGGQLAAQQPKIVYIYDDLGRLVKVGNQETGEVATYEYDAVGNMLSITRSTGGIPAPTITSISPLSVNQGETVCLRLEGTNLLGGMLEMTNPEILISNVRTTDTTLEVCLEVSFLAQLGSATLTVATPVGASATPLTVKGPLPVIGKIFPRQGPPQGGTLLTITGARFTPDASITIGGKPATDVIFIHAGVVTARTPPGPAGLRADVVLSNSNGEDTLPEGFAYAFPFGLPGALALETGGTGSLPVTLTEPAATATTVTLVSADPLVATLPGSAIIPAGDSAVGIPVLAGGEGTTQVTVTIGAASLSTVVFVSPPFAGAVDIVAAGVGGAISSPPLAPSVGTDVTPAALAALLLSSGGMKTITVTLAAPAPAGGLCVAITISNPAVATVPAEVCIPEGQQTVTFAVTALTTGEALITVTAGTEVLPFHLLVDRTLGITGAGLAAQVGSLVAPTDSLTLAPVVGVATGPTLAPVVGVKVE